MHMQLQMYEIWFDKFFCLSKLAVLVLDRILMIMYVIEPSHSWYQVVSMKMSSFE
jgi:hypothetical protein